jgi:hypothetical protein
MLHEGKQTKGEKIERKIKWKGISSKRYRYKATKRKGEIG